MRAWRGVLMSMVFHAGAAGAVFAFVSLPHETPAEDVPSIAVELISAHDSSPALAQQSIAETEPDDIEEQTPPDRPRQNAEASEEEPGPAPVDLAASSAQDVVPDRPPVNPAQFPQTLPEPPAKEILKTVEPSMEPKTVATPAKPAEKAAAKPPKERNKPAPRSAAAKAEPEKPRKREATGSGTRKKSQKQVEALAAGKGSTGELRSTDGAAQEQNYKSKILARLRNAKRYPPAARKDGLEGTSVLTFTINASGQLVSARISRASGKPALDNAALAMARSASPFPPFPAGITRRQMTFRVPVQFNID